MTDILENTVSLYTEEEDEDLDANLDLDIEDSIQEEGIQQSRKLDYSLETAEERNELVKKII